MPWSGLKAIGFAALCLICVPISRASLVIAIFNDDRLFLGSDSQATSFNTNAAAAGPCETVAKMFPVSPTCFAAMTGYNGPIANAHSADTGGGHSSLLDTLQKDSTNQYVLKTSLTNKIQDVVRDFYSTFNAFTERAELGGSSLHTAESLVVFWGYNHDNAAFFNDCFLFAPNGAVKRFCIFKRGKKEKLGDNILFQGETDFLREVLANREPKFASLRDAAFKNGIKIINRNRYMSDKAVVHFMLMLFHLHKDHARDFFPDEGYVGEPYVIYKITKKASAQIYAGE